MVCIIVDTVAGTTASGKTIRDLSPDDDCYKAFTTEDRMDAGLHFRRRAAQMDDQLRVARDNNERMMFIKERDLLKAWSDQHLSLAKPVAAPAPVAKAGGGEGSKGGKVIGHTRSGKPIYDRFDHPGHKDFSEQDHDNAATVHSDHEAKISRHVINRIMQKEGVKNTGFYGDADEIQNFPEKFRSEMTPEEKQQREIHNTESVKHAKASHVYEKLFGKAIPLLSLVKAIGEGSRGGKVVGHTRSGKPIYQRLHGSDAVEMAKQHKVRVHKHSDPMEDEKFNISPEKAGNVAREDDKLLYLDLDENKKPVGHKPLKPGQNWMNY